MALYLRMPMLLWPMLTVAYSRQRACNYRLVEQHSPLIE
jgi:hypothetical protein